MKIGAMELIVIFIVALLVIGPDKLPQYAKKFGNALREFRKASADMTQDIRESVVEPLEEAQRPLREAMEPLEELNREVNGSLKGVEKDLKNIGKNKPKEKSKGSEKEEAVPEAEAVNDSAETAAPAEPDVPAAAEPADENAAVSESSPTDAAISPGTVQPEETPALKDHKEENAGGAP